MTILTKPNNNEGNLTKDENGYNRSLSWWNLVRWLSTIGFLAVGIMYMASEGRDFQRGSFIMILIAINLLNLVYSFWLSDSHRPKLFSILHSVLDIIIFSMAISMTGGMKSPLIWSYLIPIITSSITVGQTLGLLSCVFSLISLLIIVPYSQELSFKEIILFSPQMRQALIYETPKIVSYTCLFFLSYFISSFLSDSLKRQSRVLILLNNLLDKRNRDIVRADEKVKKMEELATISRLSRTIHHELKNPLAVISMNLELIMKENSSDGKVSDQLKALVEGVLCMKTAVGKLENIYNSNSYQPIDTGSFANLESSMENAV